MKDQYKVDRKSIPVLATAQDLIAGRITEGDTTLIPDDVAVPKLSFNDVSFNDGNPVSPNR